MKRSEFFRRTAVGALVLFVAAPALAEVVAETEAELLAEEPTVETLRFATAAMCPTVVMQGDWVTEIKPVYHWNE